LKRKQLSTYVIALAMLFLVGGFLMPQSCTFPAAQAAGSHHDEILRTWKASIINKIHEEVRNIDFRDRGNGFAFCRVSFKIHRDGSITDLHTDDRAQGEFAWQVRTLVETLAQRNAFQFPQDVTDSSLKIDFALAQDDTLPISERARIPADPHSTSTVALTWDDWHKRIVEKLYNEIYRQIETLLADHQHLHCRITYRIRKLGQIELLKIEGSENLVFRGTVTRAVESLQNNPIIIFPECAGNATSITKRSEFDFHMRL
jgi:hypothetical protein